MQGINDLVTPFLAVFLSEHFSGSIDGWDLSTVPPERMLEVSRWLARRACARSPVAREQLGLVATSLPLACLMVGWPPLGVRATPAAGFHSCCHSIWSLEL